jgi:hypothetical protein
VPLEPLGPDTPLEPEAPLAPDEPLAPEVPDDPLGTGVLTAHCHDTRPAARPLSCARIFGGSTTCTAPLVHTGVGTVATPDAPDEPLGPETPLAALEPDAPLEPLGPETPLAPLEPDAPLAPTGGVTSPR